MGSRICPSEAPPIKLRSNHLQFNFEEHCLICGETCIPKNIKKIPYPWGRDVVCKTVEGNQDFLKICDQRDDELAVAMHLRIDGAISDLHAVGFCLITYAILFLC